MSDKIFLAVKSVIDSRKVKQKELSELAGISPSMLSDFVNGKSDMTSQRVASIYRILKISFDDVAGISEVLGRVQCLSDEQTKLLSAFAKLDPGRQGDVVRMVESLTAEAHGTGGGKCDDSQHCA